MGHKPWDRPWKRREKAKERRRWHRDWGVVGIHWVGDVDADPDVLPPSAAIVAPSQSKEDV